MSELTEWVANEFIQAFYAGKLQLSLDNADNYCIIKAQNKGKNNGQIYSNQKFHSRPIRGCSR